MIQYKKILMTLALLLTVTTGAWADELSESFTTNTRASVYTGEHFKITVGDVGDGGGFYLAENKYATIEALNGEIINKVEFTKGFYNINNFYCEVGTTNISGDVATVSGVNNTSLTFTASGALQIKAVKVYYTAPEPPIVVEPGEAANTWTFNQPGSDVVLTPIYAKTAAFATTGTGSVLTLLEPAAAEGVIAGTTAHLIAEGTGIVATTTIGETPKAQGTVMYAVTAATATKAPELDAADTWSADVPTAEDVADDGAEVKVWYYIQGADTPDGETPTADNTFNDSEVSSLTVTVLSNKFDLTLKAANANTIDAGDASKGTVTVKVGDAAAVDKTKDITDGKLKAIKMGSEVKLNTKQGYKFRKVEVKKKAAEKTIKIDDQNYTVLDGETWILFIIRNKLSDWSVERYDNTTWRVSKNTGSDILTLLVSTDGINWEPLKLTSNEAPIDTDKQYRLGYVN